jgi:hypothetical protein
MFSSTKVGVAERVWPAGIGRGSTMVVMLEITQRSTCSRITAA